MKPLRNASAAIGLFVSVAIAALVLGSRGVILATIICAFPFAILLTGLRFETPHIRATLRTSHMPPSAIRRWGRLILVHSHHDERLTRQGKEIVVQGRRFCAGCYGLLAGMTIGAIVAMAYTAHDAPPSGSPLIASLVPIAFVPIVARYTIWRTMSAWLRFSANALLALGCWGALLLTDAWLASGFANMVVFAAYGPIAYLRGRWASAENRSILGRQVTVRS